MKKHILFMATILIDVLTLLLLAATVLVETYSK